MHDARAPWWVIGSAAVVLHGGDTAVADVDVLIDPADAARLLPPSGVDPAPGIPDARFRSALFACWRATPLPVEFMADLCVREGPTWSPVALSTRMPVRVGAATLFVPERAEFRALLHRFGRPKDRGRAALLS